MSYLKELRFEQAHLETMKIYRLQTLHLNGDLLTFFSRI